MIRDEMKKSLTDFERFIDFVERKTGIEFYGDLAQVDVIGDYKDTTGRDLDYCIGSLDDENGEQIAIVTLAHSFGEHGDEDFSYGIDYGLGEISFEEEIPTWREAAEKAVKAIEEAK